MYAVIASGGKQYRVSPGATLRVESLTVPEGESVNLDRVLLVSDDAGQLTMGSPYIADARVNATVVKHGRGEKIHIVKFRRRKHYQKVTGHRQNYTELKITEISKGN